MLNARSPLYKTLVGAKLEVFFIFKSSGRGNRLGFAPSSQSRALCALHKLARSVRYPDSLRSIRTQIRFCGKSNQNRTLKGILPCTAQPFRLCLQEELQPDLLLTFSLNSTRAADFTLKGTLPCTARLASCLQEELPDGQSPGERKADAGKPKGRQAECFEREGNPRQ